MPAKQYDLCLPCAESAKTAYELTKVRGGVNNKITCAMCGKRRFGATYTMKKKGKAAG